MMEHVLMNFGDGARVLSDPSGANVRVDVGEIIRADIHDVHAKMIKAGIAKETLIICDVETAKDAGPVLAKTMACMRDMKSDDYDGLLERFNTIVGPNPNDLRPTREMMMIALRELARKEVKRLLNAAAKRVHIQEQGDEVTRNDGRDPPREPPRQEPPQGDTAATGKPKQAAAPTTPGKGAAKRKIKRERL